MFKERHLKKKKIFFEKIKEILQRVKTPVKSNLNEPKADINWMQNPRVFVDWLQILPLDVTVTGERWETGIEFVLLKLCIIDFTVEGVALSFLTGVAQCYRFSSPVYR